MPCRFKTCVRRLIDVFPYNTGQVKTLLRRRISTRSRRFMDVSYLFATSYRHVRVTPNVWRLFPLQSQRLLDDYARTDLRMPAGFRRDPVPPVVDNSEYAQFPLMTRSRSDHFQDMFLQRETLVEGHSWTWLVFKQLSHYHPLHKI